MSGRIAPPAMSVIVITPDCYETVRRTIQALRRQTVRAQIEVIIVGTSRERLGLVEVDLEGFAGYQVVEIGELTSTAVARAAGVRAARAPVIALTEDHCFPEPGWAEALIERHQEPWTGVGTVLRNANPKTGTSWANFLLIYGDSIDPIASCGEANVIAGHNSSYKREALLEYADDLGRVLEAEAAMQWDMIAQGHRFCHEPKAVADHVNFSRVGASMRQRLYDGRLFAANRARHWSVSRRLLYTMASPLIPLVRFGRAMRTVSRVGQARRLPRILPSLIVQLVASGVGEMMGYAMGSGRAMQRLTDEEFHRERFLCRSDRDRISTGNELWGSNAPERAGEAR